MGLGKQAKTLDAILAYLSTTRYAKRERLIFLLSAKAGLRAKEIARLTWLMVNNSTGQVGWEICLLDSASKGKSGRRIPLNEHVRNALIARGSATLWSSNRHGRFRPTRHPDGEVSVHLGAGHRQHVPSLVSAPRLRRLLESQREEDLHHQRSEEDLDGRWFTEGHSGVGWSLEFAHDAAIHRREPRSANSSGRIDLNFGFVSFRG